MSITPYPRPQAVQVPCQSLGTSSCHWLATSLQWQQQYNTEGSGLYGWTICKSVSFWRESQNAEAIARIPVQFYWSNLLANRAAWLTTQEYMGRHCLQCHSYFNTRSEELPFLPLVPADELLFYFANSHSAPHRSDLIYLKWVNLAEYNNLKVVYIFWVTIKVGLKSRWGTPLAKRLFTRLKSLASSQKGFWLLIFCRNCRFMKPFVIMGFDCLFVWLCSVNI